MPKIHQIRQGQCQIFAVKNVGDVIGGVLWTGSIGLFIYGEWCRHELSEAGERVRSGEGYLLIFLSVVQGVEHLIQ